MTADDLTPTPPTVGHADTHALRWDPSTTWRTRWTCQHCGGAALAAYGTVYGSAVDRPCGGEHRPIRYGPGKGRRAPHRPGWSSRL